MCNIAYAALYNYTFNDKNILTVGEDYMRDYLLSYQFTNNGSYTMHSADAFGQFDWNPTEHFNVISGVRFDYFSQSNVRHISPHIGLMYKIANCSLRSSYSQGFRFSYPQRNVYELRHGKCHGDLW